MKLNEFPIRILRRNNGLALPLVALLALLLFAQCQSEAPPAPATTEVKTDAETVSFGIGTRAQGSTNSLNADNIDFEDYIDHYHAVCIVDGYDAYVDTLAGKQIAYFLYPPFEGSKEFFFLANEKKDGATYLYNGATATLKAGQAPQLNTQADYRRIKDDRRFTMFSRSELESTPSYQVIAFYRSFSKLLVNIKWKLPLTDENKDITVGEVWVDNQPGSYKLYKGTLANDWKPAMVKDNADTPYDIPFAGDKLTKANTPAIVDANVNAARNTPIALTEYIAPAWPAAKANNTVLNVTIERRDERRTYAYPIGEVQPDGTYKIDYNKLITVNITVTGWDVPKMELNVLYDITEWKTKTIDVGTFE